MRLSNVALPTAASTPLDSGSNRRQALFKDSSELYDSGKFYGRLYSSVKNLIKHDNRPADNIIVSLLN